MRMLPVIWVCLLMPNIYATGGMDSGGAEIRDDRANPWFLQNTPEVKYCVVINEAGISLPEDEVKNAVTLAIKYWKDEFALVNSGLNHGLRIATQRFEYENTCDEKTDIVFQFGKVFESQKKYIPAPKKTIGMAIRTSYDKVKLRGRGFVFIGADIGPDAIEMEGMHSRPWSVPVHNDHFTRGGILHKMLVHELGHVFGIGHTGDSVMADYYPEYAIRKVTLGGPYTLLEIIPGFFRVKRDATMAPLIDARTKDYFKLPSGTRYRVIWKESEVEFRVQGANGKYSYMGKMVFDQTMDHYTPLRPIYLPAEQKVFSGLGWNLIYMPSIIQVNRFGRYIDRRGFQRPMMINWDPHGISGFFNLSGYLGSFFVSILYS